MKKNNPFSRKISPYLSIILLFLFSYILIKSISARVSSNLLNSQETSAKPSLKALPPLSSEERIVEIYKRTNPSVVNVTRVVLTYDFFLNVVPQSGTGSGFIVDERGYILTNYHVVEGAEELQVTFFNGEKYKAKLQGSDPSNDLALLKIEAKKKLPTLPLGDSSTLQVGQDAIAIGNPFGLQGSITTGVVSSVGRNLRAQDGRIINGIIQTDATLNPGNSGGPLLNSRGEVIGINSAIFSPTGSSVGIGFAIPINTAKRILPQLISKGRVSHPWLGVAGISVSPELASELKIPAKKGVLITEVVSGGPADKAGIRAGNRKVRFFNIVLNLGGDIITYLDKKEIKNLDDLTTHLDETKKAGDPLDVTFLRDGKTNTVRVRLGERPQEEK